VSKEFKFHSTVTRIRGTLREDQYTFLIISRSFLLRMRNLSEKRCGESQNARFMSSNFFFRKSWRLWGNVEKYCRARHATDDNMVHVHCILSTLQTHTQNM